MIGRRSVITRSSPVWAKAGWVVYKARDTHLDRPAAGTLTAVMSADPTPPSQLVKDVPRDLERLLLRCLRKDPARRIQYIADLAVELDEIKH
jgi:serine/threonine protein kinase